MKCIRLCVLFILCATIGVGAQIPFKHGGFLTSFDMKMPVIVDKSPAENYNLDMRRQSFYVYVPESYHMGDKFGLLVFLGAGRAVTVPPDWRRLLADRKLLYVAPQHIDNYTPNETKLALAHVAILEMKQNYDIDMQRVIVSGFATGARAATLFAFEHPKMVEGTVAICGAEYYRPVQGTYQAPDDHYGVTPLPLAVVDNARKSTRFAFVTGEKDERRGNIWNIYEEGYKKDGFQVDLFDVPGMGTQVCDGVIMSQALSWVEAKPAAR
jgi:pimeloyl-ACP methyl ester carboxylesterase